MSNAAKAQGTRWESALVKAARDAGLQSDRFAEGGSHDIGDLWITARAETWVVEAKARANLNVHAALAKARAKAGHRPAIVAWKKLVRKDGNSRRTAEGEAVVVALALDDFLGLLNSPAREGK